MAIHADWRCVHTDVRPINAQPYVATGTQLTVDGPGVWGELELGEDRGALGEDIPRKAFSTGPPPLLRCLAML